MSNKDTITLPRGIGEYLMWVLEESPHHGDWSWNDCVALDALRTAIAAEQPKPEASEVAYEIETHVLFGSGSTISRTLLEKAVTTLRRLNAENERMRDELKEDTGVIAVWRGRTERAESENERLRSLLSEARSYLPEHHPIAESLFPRIDAALRREV